MVLMLLVTSTGFTKTEKQLRDERKGRIAKQKSNQKSQMRKDKSAQKKKATMKKASSKKSSSKKSSKSKKK